LSVLVVGTMMALYVVYFGWFTVRAHSVFSTHILDVGFYDQVLWNTIHGHFFRSTVQEGLDNALADHFEPTLLVLAPLYALWQSPKTLLLAQTAALAMGALPVYWLARDRLAWALKAVRAGPRPGSRRLVEGLAVTFAAVYLLYFPMHSANVDEFHPGTLSIPLLLYAFYFLRTRRLVPYFVAIALAMGAKETLPLTVFALGLYALIVEKERVVGAVTLVASAAWFCLAVFVVIGPFNPGGQSMYFASMYGWLGGNLTEIVTRMVTHPQLIVQRLLQRDNLLYLSGLLQPVLYVPVLGLPALLLGAPGLLLNVLGGWDIQHSASYFGHYVSPIIPFVIIAAVDGTAWLTRTSGWLVERMWPARQKTGGARPAAVAVTFLLLVASLFVQRRQGYLPLSRIFYVAPRSDQVAAAQVIVDQVPSQASVSSDLSLGAHLAGRQDLYLFPNLHDADYLVADVRYHDGPFPPRDRYDSIQAMLSQGRYGVVDGQYGYLLLKRGLQNPSIPASFYGFARVSRPSPQVKLDVEFGGLVRLLGYDLIWERPVNPSAHLVLYWQALRPVDQDLRLFFILTNAMGELVPGTELEFAETVWYPPSRWQPGEVIRTQPMRWAADPPRRFGIAVGVVDGPGFWEVDKRLPPVVRAAPNPLPLLHGDSLLWLATLEAKDQFVIARAPGD
jgi:uncharacterized membrane protein